MEDFRVLDARRGYFFRPDHLRLTVLTLNHVRERIRSTFAFQTARVEAPPPTFGPILETQPPGLVFELGELPDRDNRVIPIRFLYVEAQRIVIAIAGPSSAIDEVYTRLVGIARKEQTPDGSPVISDFTLRHDLSQVTARLNFRSSDFLQPDVADSLRASFSRPALRRPELALSITLQPVDKGAEYLGEGEPNQIAHLAPRAGFPLSDGMYFSAAPLDTTAHQSYLSDLEAKLAPRRARTVRKAI